MDHPLLKLFKFILAIVIVFVSKDSNAQRVGDVMPFYDVSSSKFYVYYLRDIWSDATHQRHPWNALTTTDLKSYAEAGEKLSCSSDPCKQDYAIGTGAVIKEGSTYYAFYTGHNPNAPSACAPQKEGIMLATSTNPNSNFTKSASFTTIYPPSGYDALDNFRDPYVFKEGATYYMLVSARTSVNGTWRGVIAKYTSSNLLNWTYNGILYDGGNTNFFMMECAQVFKMGTTYYLIYSDTNSKNVFYRKGSSVNGPWSSPVGSEILSNVGYAARAASNGTNTYIWGWTVVGSTWAGELQDNLLTQSPNGDLVVSNIVYVTGVNIPPASLALSVGQSSTLTATVTPSNATNKAVTWTSSNAAIATVNATGLVTAISSGSATVTVRTNDGGFTDNCIVTVNSSNVPVSGVSITPAALTINVGQASTLTATISPSNATNKAVTWTSSNQTVATVNASGSVSGVAPGTTTVTVTTQDGGFTYNCAVTVSTPTSGIISGATYRIVSRHSGKSIVVSGGSTNDGANVWTSDYSGATSQQWVVTDIGGGFYKLIAKHSGKGMDLASGSMNNGANIQQWSYLSYANQQWSISDVGGGYHKVISRHSGKSLDLDAGSSNVQQWDYLGGTNQQWQFIKIADPGVGPSSIESDLTILEFHSEGSKGEGVYPTVIDDYFTVDLGSYITSDHSQASIEVVNVDGRFYDQRIVSGLQKVTMSARDLGMGSGLYIVKIRSGIHAGQARVIVK